MEQDSESSLEGDKESFCGDSDDDSHNTEDGSSDSDSDGNDTEDSSGTEIKVMVIVKEKPHIVKQRAHARSAPSFFSL